MTVENFNPDDSPELASEDAQSAPEVSSVADAGEEVSSEPSAASVEEIESSEPDSEKVDEEVIAEPIADVPEVAEVELDEPDDGEPEEELNEFGFSEADMVTEEDEEDDEDEDVGASPIEELVDETVHGEVDEDEMEWYILKVQVNRENSICDTLMRNVKRAGMEGYFKEVLVPTEDVREFTKAGKQRIVKRKLYPGYIVVKMAVNDDSWFLVRETSGIGDFTGAAGTPVPLSEEEINRIIATTRPVEDEESEEKIKTAIPFKEGDRVRVKEGYFQNYEGEVSTVDERNGRITVMIDIFGRPNPVELDHWHVEKVA